MLCWRSSMPRLSDNCLINEHQFIETIKQSQVNYIASCLLFCKIRTTSDLIDNFGLLIAHIQQNRKIFKAKYTTDKCFAILEKAIKDYSDITGYEIKFPIEWKPALDYARNLKYKFKLTPIETQDDLSRVTQSYDRVSTVAKKKTSINEDILNILNNEKFSVCPEIIIGEGDTGTNLWLEKFSSEHKTTKEILSQKKLPSVLMISNGTGSWNHDYTLAQPQNILERTTSKANPFDYMSVERYSKNPYANGRHIFQSNQVSLSKTEAPLLTATVKKIEKKSVHLNDWSAEQYDYRLLIETTKGMKIIYTNAINICTGLGPARNDLLGSLIEEDEFKRLNQFDSQKKFTPIVDGNQFILTDSEEQKQQKTIVIYGGGGTAAACYRKGFYGHDIRTESLLFKDGDKKNNILWFAKQFNKAGTGKLATSALQNANQRKELYEGELIKIEQKNKGNLLLTFKCPEKDLKTSPSRLIQVECDQLIYSIGQDDKGMRLVCEEIDSDLVLQFDKENMVLNVGTKDKKIIFFGAAAMAIREKEYMNATWEWLKKQNIGGDVGPGSMPPSRAQIKRYLALQGIAPKSINVNMDSDHLMVEYLVNAGIKSSNALAFVKDILITRKHSTSGGTRPMLLKLLKKHNLNELFTVYGFGHLILKTNEPEFVECKKIFPKFSLFHPQKDTIDSNIFLSSIETEAVSMDEKKIQPKQHISLKI